MTEQGKRMTALAALLAVVVFVFAACGDDDSSNEPAASSTEGVTGASGASGTSGASGARGATGKAGDTSTGGAKVPTDSSKKPAKPKKTPAQSQEPKDDASEPKDDDSAADLAKPKLATLYTQARIVCKALTLQGLAHEYEVAATPDSVARAYSKTYRGEERKAIYNGCKDGVS
jgi:hypothetical protein